MSLWRELVYDAHECATGAAAARCLFFWGGRDVEQRRSRVLGFQPDFHLVGFSPEEDGEIRRAIRDATKQITGETFSGSITSGSSRRSMDGWVDVQPASLAESGLCGRAKIGAMVGLVEIDTSEPRCNLHGVAVHELGHALGFFHIGNRTGWEAMVAGSYPGRFSNAEQFHMRLAWARGRGAPYTGNP